MILTKKEIMNKLNEITLELGYNNKDRLYVECGNCLMNNYGRKDDTEYLMFSSNSRIICYIDTKSINVAFRKWLGEKGYVLDSQDDKIHAGVPQIDSPRHLRSFTVVPKEVKNRKFYINAFDAVENNFERGFNGNFTD